MKIVLCLMPVVMFVMAAQSLSIIWLTAAAVIGMAIAWVLSRTIFKPVVIAFPSATTLFPDQVRNKKT